VFDLRLFFRRFPCCSEVFLALAFSQGLAAAPVVIGLEGKHPLDEAGTGALLMQELRCAACHDGISPSPPPSAPMLAGAASRLNPDFVAAFLLDPSKHDPGTTMPIVLGGLPDAEREEMASSMAAYVLSLKTPASSEVAEVGKPEVGRDLYHKVGCVACHGPHELAAVQAEKGTYVGLKHVGSKYQPQGLAGFLHAPLEVRASGRMPDMALTRQESADLAAYLLQKASATSELKSPASGADPERIAQGQKAFFEMNCVACHQVDAAPEDLLDLPKPPAVKDLDLNRGCLSESPGKAPNYQLSAAQRSAIRSALGKPVSAPEGDLAIRHRLTALNCIACHQRDDYGGVAESMNSFFLSTEEALGDAARIPPDLTHVGAKLRPEWMNKVLYDGERVRPYMTTRMPQYGREALGGLTELFGECDHLPAFEFKEIEQESNPMMRNGAHMLLGIKGLNCIACHNFNGKDSPGMKGLDLMTSYQRLQPAWFNQFLRNPASLRPGIIMPSFWPGGQAVQTEILNGNTEDQLRALWFNFSLGRSARDPEGLGASDPKLVVTDTIQTYRGRSNIAGYRGIAVGYPGGLSYAFNAQNGTISGIWLGEFVTVGWLGQGSGNFNPIGRPVPLSNDLGFLPEAADPWPLQPVRTKEHPVNPDPLYPRQYGYAFEGYSIGEGGRPTFRYRIGKVSIEDSSVALIDQTPVVLRRTLTFKTDEADEIYLRALTGEISKLAEGSFKRDSLQLNLSEDASTVSNSIRPSTADGVGKELIIRFKLPSGTSSHTIDYAVQR